MEELTALIYNFNTNCHKQYTNVSKLLGGKLDLVLKEIELFYYSDFWIKRFRRRLKEEGESYIPIQLDIIQGVTSELRENTNFKLFNEDASSNGVSNYGTMIALNVNMSKDKLNDSHISNVVMHEFGHRQYNDRGFNLVIELNRRTIGDPTKYLREDLSEKDYKYFTDPNELRQRIIPIIKEMQDNNWTLEETYELSSNFKMDDIKDIFKKEYILRLLDNIL